MRVFGLASLPAWLMETASLMIAPVMGSASRPARSTWPRLRASSRPPLLSVASVAMAFLAMATLATSSSGSGASVGEQRPAITALGLYGGYPSVIGAMVTAPVDATLGFRSGLTAFPGQGVLWSPGFELRFRQVRGAYGTDGTYLYGNGLFGRSYTGRDKEKLSLEAGAGYRWFLSDVRGVRWIAGVEAGGWWKAHSMRPHSPGLRMYWMFARY